LAGFLLNEALLPLLEQTGPWMSVVVEVNAHIILVIVYLIENGFFLVEEVKFLFFGRLEDEVPLLFLEEETVFLLLE
jgi:hypothetical protein